MKQNTKLLLIFVITALLAACSSELDKAIEDFAPKHETALASQYLSEFERGEFDNLKANMHSDLLLKATDEELKKVYSYFREGKLISRSLIGYQGHVFGKQKTGAFAFEYQFSDGWNVADIVLTKENDSFKISRINLFQTENSQKELNAFSLNDKSLIHYIILVFVIAIPVFILVTIFFCVRTPIPKRKWLWILFILLGFVSTKLNWTTGQVFISPLSFQLFGAGFVGGNGPWVLSVAFPLGAIIFWFKRKKWITGSTS